MGGCYLLKYNRGDSGIKIFVLHWRCSLIRVSVPAAIPWRLLQLRASMTPPLWKFQRRSDPLVSNILFCSTHKLLIPRLQLMPIRFNFQAIISCLCVLLWCYSGMSFVTFLLRSSLCLHQLHSRARVIYVVVQSISFCDLNFICYKLLSLVSCCIPKILIKNYHDVQSIHMRGTKARNEFNSCVSCVSTIRRSSPWRGESSNWLLTHNINTTVETIRVFVTSWRRQASENFETIERKLSDTDNDFTVDTVKGVKIHARLCACLSWFG
jgi:hypothetical protein